MAGALMFAGCMDARAVQWQEVRSEHFIVYYLEDKPFAGEVSRRAEEYYRRIAADLGYVRYSGFWKWDERAKIYIYRTHEEFLEETNIPRKWAKGVARYEKKEIASFRAHGDFLDGLLPHEIAHLIFRDFVGFPLSGEGVPLWIDEGVAQWAEKNTKTRAGGLMRAHLRSGVHIPFSDLTELDVRKVDDQGMAHLFYVQSITIIDFLIQKYGGERFTRFARGLRDGKSVDAALSAAYTNYIAGINDLEKKWIEYYGV